MATKHTLGPWWVFTESNGSGFEIYGGRAPQKKHDREVCRINAARSGAHRGQAVRYYLHPDDAANAHLIAASPKMYAALEECKDLLDTAVGLCNDPEAFEEDVAYYRSVFEEQIRKVCALLAEAEGNNAAAGRAD